jgi:predicted PurR-regulated permease PerM
MPAVEARSSAILRNATVILAVIACGGCLYILSDILTPLALALFLAVMIDGFARVLEHRLAWLSQRWAVPVAILLSLILFGGTCFFIADNAAGFASQLNAYTPKLNSLIAYVAGAFGFEAPPSIRQIFHQLDPAKYLGSVARAFQSFTVTAGLVLVYTAFIIASRRGWARKVVGLFPNHVERHEAVATFQRIRNGVEQYLWVQTVTGLMIAVGSWVAMLAVGLDNAVFWAFLIFIASYIPVIGGVIAVAAPPIFALVQFSTYWQAIVLFGVLQAISMIVGNVIYPRMQGQSLNIDPLIVLLALAFWGAIWGLTGAFLSTPLTVALMVILAQFDGTRWIAVILSADGDPQQLKHKKLSETPDATPSGETAGRQSKRS